MEKRVAPRGTVEPRRGKRGGGARESLEWAVSFAGRDLDELREGDWLNLRDDLARFFGGVWRTPGELTGFTTRPNPLPQKAPQPEILRIQREARRLLERAATPLRAGGDVLKAAHGFRLAADWSIEPVAGIPLLSAIGSLRDLFLTRLLFLLAQEGLANVKLCPAPGCGRPFWRAGRRKYCSSRCTFQGWLSTSEKGKTRPKREAKAARERRKYKRRLAERKGGTDAR